MKRAVFFFLICCGYLFGQEPIDVVFTWVDGSDPVWVEKKEFYMHQEGSVCRWAGRDRRFRNRDELKYALRSINDFAPFVRRIFIVTDDQKPNWFKSHPKIQIVSHKEIFPWPEYLPVFNSEAIEANLHRIPGLSEKYVYFNDDFLLGREVSPEDFFTESGQMKFFETAWGIPNVLNEKQAQNACTRTAWNTSQVLKRLYGEDKKQRFLLHVPYVMRKSVVEEAEREFPEVFQKNSSLRFRSPDGYRVACCLIPYVGLYTGKAIASKCDCYYFPFKSSLSQDSQHAEKLFERRPAFFCVQDMVSKIHEDAEESLTAFFERYFPNPAPWE